MVNVIWLFLFIIGIGYALITGNVQVIHEAIFASPKRALLLLFNLAGLYILWSGILAIVKDTKLIDLFSRKMYFITKFLYPDLPKDHPVHGYIAINMASNMFGLGSVSTPLGIKAMEEMKKLNGDKDTASRSMITLIVINASNLTLLPTTLIAIREVNGSTNSVGVLPYVLLVSTFTTIVAIILDRIFYSLNKKTFD